MTKANATNLSGLEFMLSHAKHGKMHFCINPIHRHLNNQLINDMQHLSWCACQFCRGCRRTTGS